jgi:hypothetical protein
MDYPSGCFFPYEADNAWIQAILMTRTILSNRAGRGKRLLRQ